MLALTPTDEESRSDRCSHLADEGSHPAVVRSHGDFISPKTTREREMQGDALCGLFPPVTHHYPGGGKKVGCGGRFV
ncbi:hypothetical protein CRENBAI_004800 [Crenichthys baileyi]|uniref:Uncharacterized protein n=1 Tax=Crenichthys baileyi TaxID=28760 RepID=A0AAV9QYS1_9TELE